MGRMTALPYVLLDDSLTPGGRSLLYTEPEQVVVAHAPADVEAALDAIEAGLARGLHAAGFFSYELGYCLEPKLNALLPSTRNVPLLWIGLFLSFSRSAWLAAGLALPVAVIGVARRRPVLRRSLTAALAAVAILACTGAMLFAPQLATRLSPLIASIGATTAVPTHERLSLRYRVSMARIALAAIAAHPVAGIGAGNFPLEMQRRGERSPQYVHNVPLLLAAEVGLLGGALWVAACLAGMVGLAMSWRRGSAETIAVLSAWLAIGVMSLFDSYPWSLQAGRVLTAIVVGLADRAQLDSTANCLHTATARG